MCFAGSACEKVVILFCRYFGMRTIYRDGKVDRGGCVRPGRTKQYDDVSFPVSLEGKESCSFSLSLSGPCRVDSIAFGH